MRFNKNILALAAATAVGATGSAQAEVVVGNSDLFTDAGTQTYASQIDVSSTTVLAENMAGDQGVATSLGFGVSAGATRFIRFDFTGDAAFTSAVAAGQLTVAVDGTAVTQSVASSQISVVEGGTQGDSFVIFEFTANDGSADFSLGQSGEVVFDVSGLQVDSTNGSGVEYRLYETGTAASNEGTELAGFSRSDYLAFANALDVTVSTPGEAGESSIDVAEGSQLFTGGDNTTTDESDIGELALSVVTSPVQPLWSDGNGAVLDDFIGDDHTLTLSGDYSAVDTSNTANVQFRSGTGDADFMGNNSLDADTLNATEATFNFGTVPMAMDTLDGDFVMTVTGSTTIPEQLLSATFDPDTPAGASTATAQLGDIAELAKNGSEATTNLNLDPNGNFPNFVRITNRSGITGDVFLRVFNDAGDSVSISLGDVAGQSDDQLEAQASTTVIPIGDVLDAAQAVDSNFSLTSDSRNKLRITAEGEFPEIAIDNITTANDGSTFSTFQ
jgi:hypothetical protein